MSKKHFIALAEKLRDTPIIFTDEQLYLLASFCEEQNHKFKTSRWIGYIRGECGPSGGKVK